MKATLLFMYIVIIILFSACKKEKTGEAVNSIRFSRNVLDFVNLKPGKYFIYKDSAAGLEDSVVVTTSILSSVYYPKATGNWITIPAHTDEKITLMLDTKKPNGTSLQWFYGTAEAYSYFSTASDTSYVLLWGGETNTQSEVFLQYHYQNSTDIMTVEGITYNKVVTDINDNGLQVNDPSYRKTIYYWAKGIGIIKRTVITTGGVAKTYTLLRHN